MTEIHSKAPSASDSSAIVEITNWSSRATLDIIGTAGLGLEFNALDDPDNELVSIYSRGLHPSETNRIFAFMGLVLPAWTIRMLPTSFNSDLILGAQTIRRIAGDMIRERRQEMNRNEQNNADILSVAIKSDAFSEENLIDQLMTMLLAGILTFPLSRCIFP